MGRNSEIRAVFFVKRVAFLTILLQEVIGKTRAHVKALQHSKFELF